MLISFSPAFRAPGQLIQWQPHTQCRHRGSASRVSLQHRTLSCGHAIHLMCTSLEWEEPESLEKTYIDVGRMCKLHRQWPWLGITFFPYQSYKEMMLFEDLPYVTDNMCSCPLIEESLISLMRTCKRECSEWTQAITAPSLLCWPALGLPCSGASEEAPSISESHLLCLNLPIWKMEMITGLLGGQWEAPRKSS